MLFRARVTRCATAVAILLAGTACATPAAAQSDLAARVRQAPVGPVQFTFPSRAGVCGNGTTYLSTGPGSYSGTFTGSVDETLRREPCEPGPVRVVLRRDGSDVLEIGTAAGPPSVAAGATDLGAVDAAVAVDYLLGLAARLEGNPARQALMPAMLAAGTPPWDRVLALARDHDRPLDVRRSAIGWLARPVGEDGARAPNAMTALTALARDGSDRPDARQAAVRALARLDDGAGVSTLLELARGESRDAWLARAAMESVAGSGDPRARAFLRQTVTAPTTSAELRRLAVRGVGRSGSATGDDVTFLREQFARLDDAGVRTEVLRAVGGVGGRENVGWLLSVASDEAQPVALRRAALQGAVREQGVSTTELVGLYDRVSDRTLRQELLALLARRTDDAAIDKLIAVARGGEDRTLQRRAISLLSRSDTPRVRAALAGIVEKP